SFVPMQFNTALGFSLLGTCLFMIGNQHYKSPRWLAPMLVTLGGLTLLEYLFKINLGIDELFMKHYVTVATSHPGRMAPNTALCFTLSGTTIVLMVYGKRRLIPLYIASALGALVIGLGTVAFLGYLSNVTTAYGWGKLTRMALHTSLGFMISGGLLILAAQVLCLRRFQALMLPMLPITSTLMGLTVTVSLWQAIEAAELEITTRYHIQIHNFVSESILFFGVAFSLILGAAIWFAQKSQQQLRELQQAQAKILELNNRLQTLSYLDGLTGIANRRQFDRKAKQAWEQAYQQQRRIGILIIDVDYFKAYNDRYGHPQGDVCLRLIAETLAKNLEHPEDLAARYGGEEFVLLLTDLPNPEVLRTIAEHMLGAIRQLKIPHTQSQINQIVTSSIGGACCIPQDSQGFAALFAQADEMLYQAKAQGRNRIALMPLVQQV
ncbi:MAG: diguanylate cyclase, partial [Prochlorotrichaceae cyanobacterium]